jgi:hypothetical protein
MRAVPLHIFKELREGRQVYAEIAASRPDLRAWVVATPSKDRFRDPKEFPDRAWYYLVYKFEVKAYLVERDLDVAGEEEFEERYTVHSFAELDDILERMVGDPSRWQTVRESDCPL